MPGVARGHLDLLGWHSKRASLGYDQSVGHVVVNVQEIVSRSVPIMGLKYCETELREKMGRFISERFSLDLDSVMSALCPVMFESVAEVLVGSVVTSRSSLASSSSQVPIPFPGIVVGLERRRTKRSRSRRRRMSFCHHTG